MAVGVPVVTSADAIYGMQMKEGEGIFLTDLDQEMADLVCRLVSDRIFLEEQSRKARKQIESQFDFPVTYGRLARDLFDFVKQKNGASLGSQR